MSKASVASGASDPQCGSESEAQQEHCIMYHGTTLKAARRIQRYGFIPSADGSIGPGIYVSRSFRKAVCYPPTTKRSQRCAILKLQVRLGKVKEINMMDPQCKSWHQAGYDSAWIPADTLTGRHEEHCIWDPKQITVLNIITPDHNNCFKEPPNESSV